MKNIILALSLLSATGASAWNVSTEPSMQSALIEEYTGIHCPNCPDGHAIAASLTSAHPEDVFTVAIHSGSYAKPYAGEPNFVVPLCDALKQHFGVTAYPSATVSRQYYGSTIVILRQLWMAASHAVVNTPSPVNLWTTSTYNSETHQLRLDIEGYLTDDIADPRLNVFLLQNDILGPQLGANKGIEYPHRHMLRGRLTDNDFGDPIEQKSKGEYFSRTITYTLPQSIGGVAVVPSDIELLTFVTNGDDNVYKVSKSIPVIQGVEPVFEITTAQPPIPISKSFGYGFDFFEMSISNTGNVPMTSAEFEVTLNGKKQTCEWRGAVPPHTNQLIRVPLQGTWNNAMFNDGNQYIIRMAKANGTNVDCESIRGSFDGIVVTCPEEFTLKIKTDRYAGDNTYRILDRDGDVVKEFGPYENNAVDIYSEEVSLKPEMVYCLEVADRWGDGIDSPAGYVQFVDKNGKQLAEYREIKDNGIRSFFRTDASTSLSSAYMPEVEKVEYYDLAGRAIRTPEAGIYVVRTTYTDGTVRTTKTILH